MSPLTKICEQCGTEFQKPYTEGKPAWERRRFCSHDCKAKSQKGKAPHNKGVRRESRAQKIPCRICGKPTRYNGTEKSQKFGLVHCGGDECRQSSRELKNKNISVKHSEDYESGKRKKAHHAWKNVSKIGKEEWIILDDMTSLGFVHQYKFATGLKGVYVPKCFWLDFAHVDKMICVEIDGHVHRLRRDRDARRDAILKERGWNVVRIPAHILVDNYGEALKMVISALSTT